MARGRPTVSVLIPGLLLALGCHQISHRETRLGDPLKLGDRHFERGDYVAATQAYEEYLADAPQGQEVARVFFRLGLIYALPDSPVFDAKRARWAFRELVDRFPASPYRAPAEHLLRLEAELLELRNQLEELKKIDLETPGSR